MMLDVKLMALFVLTLVAFYCAKFLYKKGGQHVLLQPLLIAIFIVVTCLWLFDVGYEEYLSANGIFQWLLGPAVVSLAVPLYKNIHHIKKDFASIGITILFASVVSVLFTWGVAFLLDFKLATQIALLTKSATTPIALSINDILHGHKELAAGIVMFTGLAGAMFGPMILSRMGFHDHRIQGVALGLTSHAIGTQKAHEISPLCGAFSALAMTLTGILLAIMLPLLESLLSR